ncbi:hypothetical protein GZL_07598 [Streptomyces sp. 769]|nr:hypothetical protein GZL_07598 [Streptomyces sp. 769]
MVYLLNSSGCAIEEIPAESGRWERRGKFAEPNVGA